MEISSTWPFDPKRKARVCDSEYSLPYLAKVAESFGLGRRWAYRRSYSDKKWFGIERRRAEELLWKADAVLNVSGATRPRTKEGLEIGNLVYFGTDPIYHEVLYAQGDRGARRVIDQHDSFATYGENIGTKASPLPPLPRLKARTRQPILLDLWNSEPPARSEFTTVCNWRQDDRDIEFQGETYFWSKHHELLKFIDLPLKTEQSIELAMGLVDANETKPLGEVVPAIGMTMEERILLHRKGWLLTDAHTMTENPWPYRDYVRSSRAEFTVAKDQNVRLKSGWFSERSACYLAAGRPVITQDTGFGTVLPTGEGLFFFNTMEEILEAIEAINCDYKLHSTRARQLAQEYFDSDKVLSKLLDDLGI